MRKSKNRYFNHIFVSPGDAWGNHTKCCMDGKRIWCLQILAACTHLSSTVSQLFEPEVQKIAIFRYCSPHFGFPWSTPATITQYVPWMERQFNACQTPCRMYLSIFNSFRVIRCLSQCASPKIAIFTTFLFPLGTPLGNHAKCCMDWNKFDAYTLSRCMCPSSYNRFWDRAKYWSKIVNFFHTPFAFDAPRYVGSSRNSATRLVWKN